MKHCFGPALAVVYCGLMPYNIFIILFMVTARRGRDKIIKPMFFNRINRSSLGEQSFCEGKPIEKDERGVNQHRMKAC